MATASTSRRGWRRWRSRAASASPAWCATRSATSSPTCSRTWADVKQIGRELGVRYLIEGSVRRAGDHVQVNVQLIDAEIGAHVWADRFDTNRLDLAGAQNEITGRLARSLNLELVEAAGRRIEQEKAADP